MPKITLNLDHGNFFCPVTGQNILSSENCEASPATAFIFLDETQKFAHISDHLNDFQNVLNDGTAVSGWGKFLASIKDNKNLVVFSITACDGPSSDAVHVGIDMNFCEEAE